MLKMTSKAILDTHTFLWFVGGNKAELNQKNISDIEQYANSHSLYLSAISLWEISMLAKKGRITLEIPCLKWIDQALQMPGLELVPLTPAIAVESSFLPGDFHGDPADRMIVATARVIQATLITRDVKIINYGQQGYMQTSPL